MRRLLAVLALGVGLPACHADGGTGTIPADTPSGLAMSEVEAENQRALYAHAVKLAEMFLEWRHRVMRFTFTAVSALLALSAWMYDHAMRGWMASPLVLGALICAAALVFDRRNEQILDNTYASSASLASALGARDGGPLTWIKRDTPQLLTYYRTLEVLYALLAACLAGLAIAVAVVGPVPARVNSSLKAPGP